MKSFNISSLVAAILIAACTFVSCKKDNDVPAPGEIMEGTWNGLYGEDNDEPAFYFELVIHRDGTLQVKSGNPADPYVMPGTWSLHKDVFKAVYHDQDAYMNLTAKLDGAKKKLSGNWGYGKENPDSGNFLVTKQ